MKSITATLILAASLSQMAIASSNVLILPSLRQDAAPVMDGTLDDPAWQDATVLELDQTVLQLQPAIPGTRTTMRLLAGDGKLYLGVESLFPPTLTPQGRVREHDAPVFEDDSIEIFIGSDGRPDSPSYYHFAINVRGSITERKLLDPSWNVRWQHAVSLGKDRWTATLAIPLAALVDGEASGHYWRLSACRNLYNELGSFVQGMTVSRPGYYRPAIPLVPGSVNAAVLLTTVNSTLEEMEGVMKPHLSGEVKQQHEQLMGHRNMLQTAANTALSKDKAATLLETALKNAGNLENMIIWNHMFE